MQTFKYLIIGGGVAAGYAAQTFVEAGLEPGQLAILSAESHPPYDRPPLSKDFLRGEMQKEAIWINEPEFYPENGIELLLDTPATKVDFDQRKVYADGTPEAIGFEKLLIATGSRVRILEVPGGDLNGIRYLRKVGDSEQIRTAADSEAVKRAVVIGAGFIGMEAAAVLCQLGIDVTLVYPEEQVWSSIFTPEMAQFFENAYRAHGVKLASGENVQEFTGRDGNVTQVVLQSGRTLPADLVVAGIGVVPNIELFEETELALDGGIIVDEYLESNIADVFAAGDIARYTDTIFDKKRRLEHWDNASRQGKQAAKNMLGERESFINLPYFFSDVFDLSYEYWGDSTEADAVAYRGDVADGSFSVWWTKDAHPQAVFVLNRPDEERELAQEWIKQQDVAIISQAILTDADKPLESAYATA